jgi:predicted nucleic acid-binding protein
MAYLLDANVFIQAKNLHYGFSFCPAFWDWIIRENRAGKVFSVDKVRDEIMEGNDELAQWAAQYRDNLFLALAANVLPAMRQVSAWVANQQYAPAAASLFLQDPDYYLVAQALAGGHVVITHEKPEDSIKRVKIPNVCIGVEVAFMNPFEMLRRERALFVLAERGR